MIPAPPTGAHNADANRFDAPVPHAQQQNQDSCQHGGELGSPTRRSQHSHHMNAIQVPVQPHYHNDYHGHKDSHEPDFVTKRHSGVDYEPLQHRFSVDSYGARNSTGRRGKVGRHNSVEEDMALEEVGLDHENARSEARQQQFNKTKLCKFFIMGICAKKDNCQFAHDRREMRPLPNLGRTKLCKTLIEKGSCRNQNCTYAHSKDELRATSAFLKTKLCKFFMSPGAPGSTCALGDACRYAHSDLELRQNLDEAARIEQEQHHISSMSPDAKNRKRSQNGLHDPFTNARAEPTHINLNNQVPQKQQEMHQQRQKGKGGRNSGVQQRQQQQQQSLDGPQERLSHQGANRKQQAFRAAKDSVTPAVGLAASNSRLSNRPVELPEQASFSSGMLSNRSGVLGPIEASRHNQGPGFGPPRQPRQNRKNAQSRSSGSLNTDEGAEGDGVDKYELWRKQMPLPLIANGGQKQLQGARSVGGLFKGTIAATSFGSLEVLAENEPAFVALSECEEDGCTVERASIVAGDGAEQTVTEQNDASWVVKNTFLEFRDEDEGRPTTFPLRNVRSAFACLSSLDNFNAV
eukprot:GEMP01026979.1.p1 GENE.GEMP01026979.1~~GEMP01026979.1.p1  ORF type:complete len:596 (+),score=108.94 GEMP01026979.1:62-1789(+)